MLKTVVLMVAFWSISSVSSARERADELLIYTEHLPPLQYVDPDGRVSGFSVDVITMALERMQLDVRVEALPWQEAYRIALREPNVVLFSLIKTDQREPLFHWLGSVFDDQHPLFLDTRGESTDMRAWVTSDASIVVDSLEDLTALTTCVAEHDVLAEHLKLHLKWPAHNVTYTDTWSQSWEMFFAGRCDVVLGREAFVTEYMREKLRDFDEIRPLFSVQPFIPWPAYYFVASKKTKTQWVTGLRRALEEVKTHPDYSRHYRKWRHILQLSE